MSWLQRSGEPVSVSGRSAKLKIVPSSDCGIEVGGLKDLSIAIFATKRIYRCIRIHDEIKSRHTTRAVFPIVENYGGIESAQMPVQVYSGSRAINRSDTIRAASSKSHLYPVERSGLISLLNSGSLSLSRRFCSNWIRDT